MYDSDHKKNVAFIVVSAMWRNWAMAFGSLVLPIACALFIKRLYIPFIIFAELYFLVAYARSNRTGMTACNRFTRVAEEILAISTVIMLGISILCSDFLIPTVIHLDLYNTEIPFIVSLVIFPVAVGVCGLTLVTGIIDRKCRLCRRVNNFYAGDSLVGTVYYREVRYQISILLIISLVIGALEFWYYFTRYINSDINVPDCVFFIYMPVVVYLVSLVVMASRYANMYSIFRALEESKPDRTNTTRVRFLVFCDSDLLLRANDKGRWDTPVEEVIPFCQHLSEAEAQEIFENLTHLKTGYKIRYGFTTPDLADRANTMHYFVFVVPEAGIKICTPEDSWHNAYMLDFALQRNNLTDALANELYRVHTITMAWKMYDRRGLRKYKIKHYRPSFRFGDMPKWDVDYDDLHWFVVSDNNEDRPFFRTRKFWHRFTGVLARLKALHR